MTSSAQPAYYRLSRRNESRGHRNILLRNCYFDSCTFLASDTVTDFAMDAAVAVSGGLISSGTTRSLYTPCLLPITDLTRSNTPAFSIFSHRPSVCQRLFQPTKPYAATSMHHSVDHLITHGNVDQAGHATTGWSTSVRTPAVLQLIYGAGLSSVDTE